MSIRRLALFRIYEDFKYTPPYLTLLHISEDFVRPLKKIMFRYYNWSIVIKHVEIYDKLFTLETIESICRLKNIELGWLMGEK